MRRILLALLVLSIAVAVAGCPVFTRSDHEDEAQEEPAAEEAHP